MKRFSGREKIITLMIILVALVVMPLCLKGDHDGKTNSGDTVTSPVEDVTGINENDENRKAEEDLKQSTEENDENHDQAKEHYIAGNSNLNISNLGYNKPSGSNLGSNNQGENNPGSNNPGNDNPNGDNPGSNKPGNDNPNGDNPGSNNPGNNNPNGDNPGSNNPGNDKPNGNNPGNSNTGNDKPNGNDPGGNNPGSDSKLSYDMSGVSFEGATYTYDETSKALSISGKLPEGVSVTYENNEHTDAGSYEVIAHFEGADDHEPIADMKATLVIEKANFNAEMQNSVQDYTGTPQTLTLPNTIPEEVSTTTIYKDSTGKVVDAAIEPGIYTVVTHFESKNYNDVDDEIVTLTITAPDISKASLVGEKSLTYDKLAHTLEAVGYVEGTVKANYTYYLINEDGSKTQVDEAVNAGNYEVVANLMTITGNTALGEISDTFEIQKKVYLGFTVKVPENYQFNYDGFIKSLIAIWTPHFPESLIETFTYYGDDDYVSTDGAIELGDYTVVVEFELSDPNCELPENITTITTAMSIVEPVPKFKLNMEEAESINPNEVVVNVTVSDIEDEIGIMCLLGKLTYNSQALKFIGFEYEDDSSLDPTETYYEDNYEDEEQDEVEGNFIMSVGFDDINFDFLWITETETIFSMVFEILDASISSTITLSEVTASGGVDDMQATGDAQITIEGKGTQESASIAEFDEEAESELELTSDDELSEESEFINKTEPAEEETPIDETEFADEADLEDEAGATEVAETELLDIKAEDEEEEITSESKD